MEEKKEYKLTINITEEQADQMIIKTGKQGFPVRKAYEILTNDITGEEAPDDAERVNLAKRWFEKLLEKYPEPTFLTYSLRLSDGDFREFTDCLLSLKQKQDKIKEIEAILQIIKEGSIEDMDSSQLSELKRICQSYGVEVDEIDLEAIEYCLNDEKLSIQADMYIPDLGFEPDNLYSPVDAVVQTFDDYCKIYELEDADINKELKAVISWITDNEKHFQPIN